MHATRAARTGLLVAGRIRLGLRLVEEPDREAYAAIDERSGHRRAVEILRAVRPTSGRALDVFRGEALRARAAANRAVAVPTDAAFTDDGFVAIVYDAWAGELVAAPPAAPMPVADAIDVACQLLEALGCAHAAGITHLDVRMSRLFVESVSGQSPRLCLTGLGVASATRIALRDGLVVPCATTFEDARMLAPEQCTDRFAAQDAHVDVWAAAVLAYTLLTGSFPFDVPLLNVLLMQIQRHTPLEPSRRRAEVPKTVDTVLLRALAKPRKDRYPDAIAFRKELLGAWATHRFAGLSRLEERARALAGGPSSSSSAGGAGGWASPQVVPRIAFDEDEEDMTPTALRFDREGLPRK